MFPLRMFFLLMNKKGSTRVFQCPPLSFCSLGREQEGRELTVVEMGGGVGVLFSAPPTVPSARWLNFRLPWAARTQRGEPPVPGRQADAAEWLAHARCVRFPLCQDAYQRRVGPISSPLSLPWAVSSLSQRAGGLSAGWESPQQD